MTNSIAPDLPQNAPFVKSDMDSPPRPGPPRHGPVRCGMGLRPPLRRRPGRGARRAPTGGVPPPTHPSSAPAGRQPQNARSFPQARGLPGPVMAGRRAAGPQAAKLSSSRLGDGFGGCRRLAMTPPPLPPPRHDTAPLPPPRHDSQPSTLNSQPSTQNAAAAPEPHTVQGQKAGDGQPIPRYLSPYGMEYSTIRPPCPPSGSGRGWAATAGPSNWRTTKGKYRR
jgi:hypothetical protein